MPKITRNDVARLAKVSTATVSRVFNSPQFVSSGKVKKVKAAAKKLGYVPNKFASALRRSSSGTILFLEKKSRSTPRFSDEKFYLWIYAEVIRAVKSAIDSSMYHLQLESFSSLKEFKSVLDQVSPSGVIIHQTYTTAVFKELKKRGIPYVSCYRTRNPSYNHVYMDETAGGFTAGTHLLETGHKKPAHITGILKKCNPCMQRWEGFRHAVKKAHLIDGALGIQGGYESGKKLVSEIRDKTVDSVFVVNDLTSIGVIQALHENGIRIPDDVSIIGYDNIPFIDTLPFRLTTIDISINTLYSKATELLLESIHTGEKINETVKPVLVRGESVLDR